MLQVARWLGWASGAERVKVFVIEGVRCCGDGYACLRVRESFISCPSKRLIMVAVVTASGARHDVVYVSHVASAS